MKTSLAFKFAHFARRHGLKFNELNDPRVLQMKESLQSLGKDGIQFDISVYADGNWSARSVNIDGIITGGINQSEMNEMIKDAIFTYYGIAPQFSNDALLKSAGEKKTVKNEIYVTA